MPLRDYQRFGVDQAWEFMGRCQPGQHGLMLYPTGVGKSWIIATLIGEAVEMDSRVRVMNLIHNEDLVDSNSRTYSIAYPDHAFGIYCDGLKQKNAYENVTFGSIQSVAGKASIFGHIDIVYIDEAHLVSDDEQTQYRELLAELTEINPNLVVIGFTATGYRMRQGMLTQGEGALFDEIIVDATDVEAFNWFFDEGYLIEPVPRKTGFEVSGESLRLQGGEFALKQDQELMNQKSVNEKVVFDILAQTEDRHCGMLFATGVDHCKALHEIMEYWVPGLSTWVASRGMTKAQRKENLQGFKLGHCKWIINNGILTTGFDHPPVDVLAICRHLMSPGLWVQILGRGTRPLYAPGFDLETQEGRLDAILASYKQNTLVLDYCQNATRLGPINAPRVPKSKEKGTGDAPVKFCEDEWIINKLNGEKMQTRKGCGWMNHASLTACKYCGEPFPRGNKLEDKASTARLVKRDGKALPSPKGLQPAKQDWVEVNNVTYSIHKKPGRPDSFKVTYQVGSKLYQEFLCFQDPQYYPRDIAKKWWRRHSDYSPPSLVADAYNNRDHLKVPRRIKVTVNSKLSDIHDYEF